MFGSMAEDKSHHAEVAFNDNEHMHLDSNLLRYRQSTSPWYSAQ
jgi:hypothetical protein